MSRHEPLVEFDPTTGHRERIVLGASGFWCGPSELRGDTAPRSALGGAPTRPTMATSALMPAIRAVPEPRHTAAKRLPTASAAWGRSRQAREGGQHSRLWTAIGIHRSSQAAWPAPRPFGGLDGILCQTTGAASGRCANTGPRPRHKCTGGTSTVDRSSPDNTLTRTEAALTRVRVIPVQQLAGSAGRSVPAPDRGSTFTALAQATDPPEPSWSGATTCCSTTNGTSSSCSPSSQGAVRWRRPKLSAPGTGSRPRRSPTCWPTSSTSPW